MIGILVTDVFSFGSLFRVKNSHDIVCPPNPSKKQTPYEVGNGRIFKICFAINAPPAPMRPPIAPAIPNIKPLRSGCIIFAIIVFQAGLVIPTVIWAMRTVKRIIL